MPRAESTAEEVSFIPLRHLALLSDFVSDQEIHERPLRGGRKIQRLIHIVLWSVVTSDEPLLYEFKPIDIWVCGFDAIGNVDRRNALQNEGILIAADEHDFFRHRIRTEIVSQSLGR